LIRFLVGLAFGIGQPAQNALGMEIVPAERRVHATCVGCLSFCAGQVYSALIIWLDDPGMKHLDWRWIITMGAIPWVILWLIAYFTIYESPAFLAIRGKHEEARDVLSHMRKLNGRPEVAIDFEPPQSVPHQSTSTEIYNNLRIIFGRNLWFTTCVTCFSTYMTNFSYSGGNYVFPQVLPEIESHLSPAMNLMLWTIFEIPGYVLTVVLGLYFLRKTCIIISQLGLVISVLSFVWAAHLVKQRLNLVIAEVVLQLGFYSFKAFVCLNYVTVRTYSGEVYPTVARTMGTALCIGAGRLGSITCPFIYEWLVDFTGSFNAFFYVLAGLNIVNAVLICLLPFETKGKALKDHADEIEPVLKA